MRVAIFSECYFPFISGVVTHIDMLKQALEEQGHEVMIVTTNPKALCTILSIKITAKCNWIGTKYKEKK